MTKPIKFLAFMLVTLSAQAQLWQQNDNIFNPSGIPSLAFSQPRFADLDGDGDFDMILGNINGPPRYFVNSGSSSSPQFQAGADLFSVVQELDCEVAVCIDLDFDGDLDLVTGGYTGLQLYDNIGDAVDAQFSRVDNYFSNLNVGANPVPHFADLDGDDDFDLVVGISEGGEIRYFENWGTTDNAIFLADEMQTWFDVGLYAYPWLSDLDADGDTDLLVGRDGFGFYYYRNDGSATALNWTDQSSQFSGLGNTSYWNSPCLVDLTGDGKQDLVHGSASGPLKYFRNSGSLANASWTEVTSLFGGVLDVGGASNPYFIDLDGDGVQDMLSGSQLGDIKYFENTGDVSSPAWSANHSVFSSIDHSIYSSVAAGDLDGDGLIDLVVGDLTGSLYYHHNTGSGFPFQSGLFGGINVGGWSSPFLMDMDRDHDLDLIIGREDGLVSFYENIGTTEAAQWSENSSFFSGIDVGSNAVVSLGDVDMNGNMDMITGDLFHELQFFSHENGAWVEYPDQVAGLTVGQNASPALVDLNGDGDLDLAVGNYDGTFNYFENRSIVATTPTQLLPEQLILHPAFPNPFNPSVNLSFELPESSHIRIAIYDLSGSMVTTLVDDFYSAGMHTIQWDVFKGEALSTGVYLAVVEDGTSTRTTKLLYLK